MLGVDYMNQKRITHKPKEKRITHEPKENYADRSITMIIFLRRLINHNDNLFSIYFQ